MIRFLVLGFDLTAHAVAFRNQTWSQTRALPDALLLGADLLQKRSGLLILRDENGTLEVLARCGSAEDRCIAAYATADVRFQRWPGSQGDGAGSVAHQSPSLPDDPSPKYLM